MKVTCAFSSVTSSNKNNGNSYIPKIDPEIIKVSQEITQQKTKAEKERKLMAWLADKVIDIAALIISIIALIRTF